MSALDRILCERLGIEPEAWSVDSDKYGERDLAVCIQQRYGGTIMPVYPALSTTGDGMLLLMDALEKHGWDWDARNGREPARVTFGVFCIELFAEFPQERRQHYATSASAPMALALAAAAALGVEVPE